ncbi:MAG: endonuclease protein [Flavipsychrobacter sp.]|nr:endonuclease protein [Flavipsychrobacter sp.]
MFLNADRLIFKNAEALRNNPTHAELIMWGFLKQKPMGYKFRRQHPISIYIADFYCHALKLIIEIDGNVHSEMDVRKKDIDRQEYLKAEGIYFIRFTNVQVEKDISYVIKSIENYIQNVSNNSNTTNVN